MLGSEINTDTPCSCCLWSNNLLSYPLPVLSHLASLPVYHAGGKSLSCNLHRGSRFSQVHLSWVHLEKHFWKGLVKSFSRNPHCQVGGATLLGLFGLQVFFRASPCARYSPELCSCLCWHPPKKQMRFTQLWTSHPRGVVNFLSLGLVFL